MNLPGILGLAEFPPPLAPFGYCPASSDTDDRRLSDIKRIGLIFKGTTGNMADYQRSIPIEKLEALADVPGVTFVPLQYDPSGASFLQAALWLGSNVEQPPAYPDVLGLANVMAGLDMVVSVDTLGAHVAGSLGVPTLMLNRFCREWRWGQHTTDTAWYQSMTMLTCPAPNDWTSVLTDVRGLVGVVGSDLSSGIRQD